MSNLLQRTLSGAVFVAVIVASIVLSEWSYYLIYSALFAIITIWAVYEYHHLVGSDRFLSILSSISAGLLFFVSCPAWYAYNVKEIPNSTIVLWGVAVLLYIILMAVEIISELFRKFQNPIANWGNFFVSQCIAVPFCLMSVLMLWDWHLLLALFILIWANDTGAYCVGSLSGKRKGGNHKMFPRVSPGKSWEGLVGGAITAIACSMLLAYCGFFYHITAHHTYMVAAIFAVVVVIFGTLGDLVESLMKRTIGVKDSGHFLPGHGGVLDRFDSIILATPAIVVLIAILMIF